MTITKARNKPERKLNSQASRKAKNVRGIYSNDVLRPIVIGLDRPV